MLFAYFFYFLYQTYDTSPLHQLRILELKVKVYIVRDISDSKEDL
jgi:hypothetical protein